MTITKKEIAARLAIALKYKHPDIRSIDYQNNLITIITRDDERFVATVKEIKR